MTSDEEMAHPPPVQTGSGLQASQAITPLAAPVTTVGSIVNAAVSPASITSTTPSAIPLTNTAVRPSRLSGAKKKVEDILTQCDQCQKEGSKENLVRYYKTQNSLNISSSLM